MVIEKDSTVAFRVLVAGRAEAGKQQAGFEAAGVAWRNGGEVGVTVQRNSALAGTGGSLLIEGGERLRVQVRGMAGSTMRWVARVELVEVGAP